jgi:uncharacterized protein (DUF58 family)
MAILPRRPVAAAAAGGSPGARASLLDARELRQLERLSIASLQAVLRSLSGQRPSTAGAAGLEFADYRPYVPGDDLRYVDWNIQARLGELLVKVAPEERRAELDILIDMSRSMDFGRPNKLLYARRLGVALGAVALLQSDAVRVYGLADGRVQAGPPLDAPSAVGSLAVQVAELRVGLQTDLPDAARAYGRGRAGADLLVLLSDGLIAPTALSETIAVLVHQAATVAFVHVLDRSEHARARGPVELRDSESGRVLNLTLGGGGAETYARSAERFRQGVERTVRGAGARYLSAPTDVEPLDLLGAGARSEGLIAS